MRMKKLLTLLLTAVIGCLPMWAGAEFTDVITPAMVTVGSNINISSSELKATYFADNIAKKYDAKFRIASGKYIQNTTAPGNIKKITITPASPDFGTYKPVYDVYVSESEITSTSGMTSVAKLECATTTDPVSYEVSGDYKYFRLVSKNSWAYLSNIEIVYQEEVRQCEVPTVSANYWVPGGTVTLTAPTEGSTLTYSWGVDAEADVATATGTTVEGAASPATITIPADAEVGKTFWVRATAKLDGYTDSEELNYTHVLGSNVLAAPMFNHPSGEIEKGTWLDIERPNNATTIHYTVNGGEEQTSTDYSVGMTIDENTTIVAYATGNAPFKESEKVTYSYTVVTPKTPIPTLYPTTGILPGTTLYLNAQGEEDTLTYSWGIKNGDENVVESGELTATEYADIKVPSDIEIGYTLWINATATRNGYDPSEPLDFTYPFEAVKLDAPTFSLPTSEDLTPGTEVTINMPSHATTLHYTLNDGEEQTSDANVTLTIKENTEVKAWATGTGIFTQSDDATASYKVLGKNVDVLVPTMWTDFTAGAYQFAEHGTATGKTGVKYEFNGGYDVVNGVNTFYFSSGNNYILYNTTGKKIMRIKLESPQNGGNFVYVGLSTEAPLSTPGTNTLQFTSADAYGIWKDAQDVVPDAQYFSVWSYSGNISRILIEYEDTSVGVEGIAAENGEAMYFDLNGAKVNSLENAVPGVYVRVANGKATKVLVK